MALVFSSCEKEPVNSGNNNQQQQGQQEQQGQQGQQGNQEPEENLTWIYAGNFAYAMMDDYYLWKKEIKNQLKSWSNNVNVDPIAKVKSIRYHKGGEEVDHWTEVTDDYASFVGDVNGVSTTYGYDFFHFEQDKSKYDRVLATVRYVYPGSPAEEAGLKRGDVIVKANGMDIPIIFVGDEGYLDTDFIYDEMIYSSSCTLTLSTGETVSMTAREMVENPVIISKVLESDEKKIGYLHYTSFTLESCPYLIEACKQFKAEGVKELILDLRYNGGGYVFTEELLMSMLAPQAAVAAGEVFSMEIYNDELMAEFEEDGESTASSFTTLHQLTDENGEVIREYDTSDANIGLEKIYVIVTGDSASASESLICCLKPFYQDNLVVMGKQTHGKYCAGYIIEADSYFKSIKKSYSNPDFQAYYSLTQADIDDALEYANNGLNYAKNWGIYVMFARYADRDGVTLSMPDGIKPDYAATDNPQDGHPLGDPQESMLKTVLRRAGVTVASPDTQQAPERIINIKTIPFNRREKPGMVKTPTSLPRQFRGPLKPLPSNGQYNRAE